MSVNQTVNAVIVEARAVPLTRHDLDIYMRFGWNDYGANQGLTSLEIGARLSATKLFWQAIMSQVEAAPLEEIAYQRDMEMWEAAANPADFWHDAQKYGVTPDK